MTNERDEARAAGALALLNYDRSKHQLLPMSWYEFTTTEQQEYLARIDAVFAVTRAQPLSADVGAMREALVEVRDLLVERIYGNPARSSAHNARVKLETILAALPATTAGRGVDDSTAEFVEYHFNQAATYLVLGTNLTEEKWSSLNYHIQKAREGVRLLAAAPPQPQPAISHGVRGDRVEELARRLTTMADENPGGGVRLRAVDLREIVAVLTPPQDQARPDTANNDAVEEALADRDRKVSICPDKHLDPDEACQVCGATSDEPCRKRVIADAEFVDTVRAALSADSPAAPEPGK